MIVKVEIWKSDKGYYSQNKRVFVARDKGKIVAWRNYAGSRMNKATAERIFNKNKTFDKDLSKDVQTLTNFRETTFLKKTTPIQRTKGIIIKRPRGAIIQYVVRGNFRGQDIIARSGKVTGSSKAAKTEAWTSFLERIAQVGGLEYDSDEGLTLISEVKNLQEGWVSYSKK